MIRTANQYNVNDIHSVVKVTYAGANLKESDFTYHIWIISNGNNQNTGPIFG